MNWITSATFCKHDTKSVLDRIQSSSKVFHMVSHDYKFNIVGYNQNLKKIEGKKQETIYRDIDLLSSLCFKTCEVCYKMYFLLKAVAKKHSIHHLKR